MFKLAHRKRAIQTMQRTQPRTSKGRGGQGCRCDRGGKGRGFTEAIIFRAGDVWKATGTNILPLRFSQKIEDTPASPRGRA